VAKVFPAIDERLQEWIRRQHMFFVATAPLSAEGLVNLSPKGLDSFEILDEHTVAYLDLVGSGAETIAHLRENGRITFLFSAFEGPPRLLRLFGRGTAFEPGDAGFAELVERFPTYAATRAIIKVEVTRIADSCGYGVPLYEHEGPRRQLLDWADRKGEDGLRRYQLENNLESLDGLPSLRAETLRKPGDP
jgi:hypothetical protein